MDPERERKAYEAWAGIVDALRVNPAGRKATLERLLRGVTLTPEEAAFLAAVVVSSRGDHELDQELDRT